MCSTACLEFVRSQLGAEEVRGRTVLEVGAFDVNGSARGLVEALGPASYLGVDLRPGRGVDEVCPAEELVRRYGPEAFDVVLSTEMLEHVRDWRAAVDNLKRVVRPGGLLLLTTRSLGFPLHNYPSDFWRFEIEDFEVVFGDFTVIALARDPSSPGVFLKGRRPLEYRPRDLRAHALYSMVTGRRTLAVREVDLQIARARRGLGTLVWRLSRRLARPNSSIGPGTGAA
jgi:SAM-dependent methyltransferase